LSLCLLAATAALTLPAAGRSPAKQEVDPDTLRILWADEEQLWPNFIPQALIGDLDLTSPETVDLSHLPMTESQKARFKFFLFAEPDGLDGCFIRPRAFRTADPNEKNLSVIELLTINPLVTIGTVLKVVPGWLTGAARPANLVFFEENETLRDLHQVATPGGTLVFIQASGAELVISGKRLCSPKTGVFEVSVKNEILLYGLLNDVVKDHILGRFFEIRDGLVCPHAHQKLLKESELDPIPLWELREKLKRFAELER